MDVFCIHLPHRTDRMENIKKLQRFYPSINFHIVEGVRHERGATGCALSHQKIIRMAKEQKRPYVWVIEDDCKLLHANGVLLTYVNEIVKFIAANPNVGIVNGCGNLDPYQIDSVKPAGGMFFLKSPRVLTAHCIFYTAACYDAFLALDPSGDAIDESTNSMNMVYTFPFLATQVTSYSDISKKDADYDNISMSSRFITYTLKEEGFLNK